MQSRKQAYRYKVLAALPGSAAEVRAKTGFGLATISRWLNAMLDAGEIHLHHKVAPAHGGPLISVYAPGPEPAGHVVKAPRISTDRERVAKYRRNARKSGAWEDVKAKRRAKYWATKAPARDPLTSALFGSTR